MTLGDLRPGPGRDHSGDGAPVRARQRGQSLTEFALILPILLLLTVAALDFGRVYLGYINIQNMARIAANYAANNPLAWNVDPDAVIQERYENQILQDASATNCNLPVVSGDPVIPSPTFTDADADGSATGLGDTVTVQLTCEFAVATPLIANILGGTVQVTAESNFPVKAGMTAVAAPVDVGGGGGSAIPPVARFMVNGDPGLEAVAGMPLLYPYVGSSVTLYLADTSDLSSTSSWAFGDLGPGSVETNPTHSFTCPSLCEYTVVLTASNAYGSSSALMILSMTGTGSYDFTADTTVIAAGATVTFTDASSPGAVSGTAYTWTFGDGSPQETTSSPSIAHAYTTSTGSPFSVTMAIDYPDPYVDPPPVFKASYVTVNPGYCLVPRLAGIGLLFSNAATVWQADYLSPVDGQLRHFTGTVMRAKSAPNKKDFIITAQSIASGSNATAPCTSDIYVSDPSVSDP